MDEQRYDVCSFQLIKINLAAAFRINCKGLIDLAREHCNSPAWTEQELEQRDVLHVLRERPDLLDAE